MKKDVPQLLTSFKPGTGIKHAFCYTLVLQLETHSKPHMCRNCPSSNFFLSGPASFSIYPHIAISCKGKTLRV